MVVSDEEKAALLQSDEWLRWVSQGRHEEWTAISSLRDGTNALAPDNPTVRYFMADLRTRYLVAEYFRERHHLRAGDATRYELHDLSDFDLGNPRLRETIAEICVAHGLTPSEIDDADRFPFRRDIFSETVNVRLLAILLRLGDLLDMRSERACPLILGAASPLPASSYPHWSQYQRIFDQSVTPSAITITADCSTQEEFGLLEDWCRWIVTEVSNASMLLSRSTRHESWRPPIATMGTDAATIQIRVARGARFIPSKWHFELDPDAVFNRLIRDTYRSSLAFVRELLQNALDATRCRMFLDCAAEGLDVPQCPSHVAPEIRAKYPILISLNSDLIRDDVTETDRPVQILRVEDYGIGMDKEVITKFLLQVGRSFYTTDEFRRRFSFAPTSRFGVGFLSVFAVSEHICIDTYNPTSTSADGPIGLFLTRPKNYLITEVGTRKRTGTAVEVRLRERLDAGELTAALMELCRRVEFPIYVTDLGAEVTIEAEKPAEFTYSTSSPEDSGATIAVRAVPIGIPSIDGEFYIFSYTDATGESWTSRDYVSRVYSRHPSAANPEFPRNLTALHGITMKRPDYRPVGMPIAVRMDYRGADVAPTMSRDDVRESKHIDSLLSRRREELVLDHLSKTSLAKGENGWRYKQKLIHALAVPGERIEEYWKDVPGTVRVFDRGVARYMSVSELGREPNVSTIFWNVTREGAVLSDETSYGDDAILELPAHRLADLAAEEDLCFIARDLVALGNGFDDIALFSRQPTKVHIGGSTVSVRWNNENPEGRNAAAHSGYYVFAVPFSDPTIFGFRIDVAFPIAIVNVMHPFMRWWLAIIEKPELSQNLEPRYREAVWGHIGGAARFADAAPALVTYVSELMDLLDFQAEMRPPREALDIDVPAARHFDE